MQAGKGFHLFGRLCGVGHGLRRQNDKKPVAAGILRHDLDGLCIPLWARVAQNVDGVVVTPVRRQQLVEGLYRLLRQLRQFTAVADQRVGREHAGSAGVGQDRQPRPFRPRLLGKHLGHVKKVGDIVDPKHAASAKRGVQNLIAAGERAGVRSRRLRRRFGPSRLYHNDRFGQRNFARGRQEGPRISDGLHVDDDAPRPRIVSQVVDEVPPVHVKHRSDGDKGAETDKLAQAPIEDCGAERAALAYEADTTGERHLTGESGIETGDRIHQTQAIRPDDAEGPTLGRGQDPFFQRGAFGAALLESCRYDDGAFHPCSHALIHNCGDRRRRRGYDGQVDCIGQRHHTGIGLDPEDAGAFAVDRKDRPSERIADEVPQNGTPHAAGRLARTDDGNALWSKKGIQRMFPGMENVLRQLSARPAR